MSRKFVIEEIGNGWLLTIGSQQPFYYASLELVTAQLTPYIKVKPMAQPTEFRRGTSQIDVEEYIKERGDEDQA